MKRRILEALINIISWFPLVIISFIGWFVGNLLYLLPNREKRNSQVNIQLSFPTLSVKEQNKLVRRNLIDNAITLFEMPSVWLGSSEKWKSITDSEAIMTELAGILAEGNGLILAVPHLGNWEVNSQIITALGDVTGLYRPPRQRWLEKYMVSGREKSGLKVVPIVVQGIKTLYKELAKGNTVFILPDQQPKTRDSGSVFAPFFGVPALTMTLISRMAKKTKAPVYYLYATRVSGKYRYRLHGFRADEEITNADLVKSVTSLNAGIETCVRQFPSQYQWTYRRFEAQPDEQPSPYKKTKK